jgi:hypothetical protein
MEFIEVGKRKFAQALEIWSECLLMDDWPGYPKDIQLLDAMPWDLSDISEEAVETLLSGI